MLHRQLTEEMSKCRGQLTEREQELLRIRRDSDTKVSQLAKMEKMLQDTKGLMEKKTMSGTESEGYRDNMGLYHNPSIFTECFFSECMSLVLVLSVDFRFLN